MKYTILEFIKWSQRILVFSYVMILISGCTTNKMTWDSNVTSSIQRKATSEAESYPSSYSINIDAANQSYNKVFESLRRSKGNNTQNNMITDFLGSMKLAPDFMDEFTNNVVYTEDGTDLVANLHYGMSSDLQIIGIHVRVISENELNREVMCIDEFDIIRAAKIPLQPELLDGRDVRLVNRYANLKAIFIEMAKDLNTFISEYYLHDAVLNEQGNVRQVDLSTYDGRVYNKVVATGYNEGLLGYRERPEDPRNCDEVHFYLVNHESIDTVEMVANNRLASRRLAVSRKKFRREQQERNRQLINQRVKNRLK